MDEKTADRVLLASIDYFSQGTFFALLVLFAGWALGRALSFALTLGMESKREASIWHRLCPLVGLIAALPLAYSLLLNS